MFSSTLQIWKLWFITEKLNLGKHCSWFFSEQIQLVQHEFLFIHFYVWILLRAETTLQHHWSVLLSWSIKPEEDTARPLCTALWEAVIMLFVIQCQMRTRHWLHETYHSIARSSSQDLKPTTDVELTKSYQSNKAANKTTQFNISSCVVWNVLCASVAAFPPLHKKLFAAFHTLVEVCEKNLQTRSFRLILKAPNVTEITQTRLWL